MSTQTIHDAEHYGRHSIAPGREPLGALIRRRRDIDRLCKKLEDAAKGLDITQEMEAVK